MQVKRDDEKQRNEHGACEENPADLACDGPKCFGTDGAEGLGLAVTMAMMEDALLSGVATMAIGLVVVLFWLGASWVVWWIYKWALPGRPTTGELSRRGKGEPPRPSERRNVTKRAAVHERVC